MEKQSDILISVDLGTTFTGVAWMTPRTPIQVINDWPGSGDRGERKVPTTLIYNADGSLNSWGFMCGDDDHDDSVTGRTRREFFKIFIDEDTLAAALQQGLSSAPKSVAEAQGFLVDYLQQIYAHVKESIEIQIGKRHTGGWKDMAVKFLFSVPTTWTNMAIINIFKGIIRDAGYGTEGPKHTAEIDLTEAEAASVATLKTSAVNFTVGSLFLTVDAGGGTTDLALMRIKSNDTASPQMSQVAAVRGVGIGSSLIDRAFIRLVAQRLAEHPDEKLPADFAARISRNHHFKTVKHKFGEKVYMQNNFKIQLEGVAYDFNHTGLRIEGGRMVFTKEEIQSLFDQQIEGIMNRITEQLDWLSDNGRTEQVEYMILAGGLGSSAYVRETIQEQLMVINHPNARQVVVIPCNEPQLVVVRGLLLDQQQKLETGNMAVLASRIARASYGVVIREPYSPATHFDEDIAEDRFNGKKKWALNQIQWLIRKGDEINPNTPISKAFEVQLGQGDTTRSWDAVIVTSQNEPSFLPRSLKQAGAKKLCSVKSNLAGIQQQQMVLKKNRKSWFRKGQSFYLCKFDVRVIVAPADLRFELWFGGLKFSGNHEPIAVKWD
ncbi:hypothetical protein G7Z17_g3034 [Cylindrodendrum hubeiense]|uniref:Hsp70 family chaperone n=1 Tax=Cylindrodendrum hubeiense TaxID=595255 RepID=A0A9P5HFG8_9HYPO|nr:hypothetical protein G7Z17_g3034 [Cylindrodendrum hubeiense]